MEADEIRRVIEEASNNNWIPVSIVIAVFGIVIALLLHIWKTSQAETKARHTEMTARQDKSDNSIDKLAESQHQISIVLTRLDTIVENHEKSINELNRHHAKA